VSFSVQACSSWSLEGQMSGNYDLAGELTRHETRWNATFTAKRFRPSRDLQIRCKAKREKAGLALHVHRDKRGKTYFMAVVASGKTALRKPVLRILGVTTENVYPQRLSTVMPNRRVLVFGRILDDGVPVARLTAATSRGPVDLAVTKSDASDSRTSSFIAGFWARGRIDEVSRGRNHLRLGEDERTEVLALAVRHGILTPLTAILAK